VFFFFGFAHAAPHSFPGVPGPPPQGPAPSHGPWFYFTPTFVRVFLPMFFFHFRSPATPLSNLSFWQKVFPFFLVGFQRRVISCGFRESRLGPRFPWKGLFIRLLHPFWLSPPSIRRLSYRGFFPPHFLPSLIFLGSATPWRTNLSFPPSVVFYLYVGWPWGLLVGVCNSWPVIVNGCPFFSTSAPAHLPVPHCPDKPPSIFSQCFTKLFLHREKTLYLFLRLPFLV